MAAPLWPMHPDRPGRPLFQQRAEGRLPGGAGDGGRDAAPRLGLPFDVWTSARLSAYLAETTGVRLAPGWVRALLVRQRFVSSQPKHTLKHLQDAEQVARCEAELVAVVGKGGGGARAL